MAWTRNEVHIGDQNYNRGLLAFGVQEVECVFAGSPEEMSLPHAIDAVELLRDNEKFGSCEMYANKAVNIFVRLGTLVVAYISYRE